MDGITGVLSAAHKRGKPKKKLALKLMMVTSKILNEMQIINGFGCPSLQERYPHLLFINFYLK